MKIADLGKVALPFVWFGAVCAISFMEAPLKFTAPNLTLPVALEIGYIVFHALNRVEWVLMFLLLISLVWTRPSKLEGTVSGFIVLILFAQTFWLLPVLDERTIAAINSRPAPDSNFHLIYIVLESVKVILLPVLGVISFRRLKGSERNKA